MKHDAIRLPHDKSTKRLIKSLINISLENPGCAVTAYVNWSETWAFIYPSLSKVTVDGVDSRIMLKHFGGLAYVNGELKQPPKGWMGKKIAMDNHDHD